MKQCCCGWFREAWQKTVLLCGTWNSPVVVGGLGKPGSETVLLCGAWGGPVVVGSPAVKEVVVVYSSPQRSP